MTDVTSRLLFLLLAASAAESTGTEIAGGGT